MELKITTLDGFWVRMPARLLPAIYPSFQTFSRPESIFNLKILWASKRNNLRWNNVPPSGGRRNLAAVLRFRGLYINLLEINDLRKHTAIFGENRHRTSIFYCKSCAKTGIRSCAKSDSGAKFSLKITGLFSFMFQQPFRRETEIENFTIKT